MDTSSFGSSGMTASSGTSEHYVVQVLAGDMETVRARLAAAVERVGYMILEEEPAIHARRGARGWATWLSSADILEYPAVLTVRLKADGPTKTRATFCYAVKHPYMGRADQAILAREAEAIAALASPRPGGAICVACGTEATEDSRFCRKCGAPMAAGTPELEILRMKAEARAGQTSFSFSLFFATLSSLLLLVGLVVAAGSWFELPKPLRLLVIFGSLGVWLTWLTAVFGALRLRNVLSEAKSVQPAPQTFERGPAGEPSRPALAAPPEPVSVTEHTTELLGEEADRRRDERAVGLGRDTG